MLSNTVNAYFTYKFLRILTTDWKDMEAYELGLIDDNGKSIKKPQTSEERSAYSLFHRLAFNIKRVVQNLPFGRTRLASYASALFLLRENFNLTEPDIKNILQIIDKNIETNLNESCQNIYSATYTLKKDLCSEKTGEFIYKKGTEVFIEDITPCGKMLGVPIYEAFHLETNEKLFVSPYDLC